MRLFLVLLLCSCLSACGYVTASGQKSGTIIKLAREGIIFKTWEAEIVRGGMTNGSGGFSTIPFHVTISDKDLLPKVKTAFESGKEVRISYKKRYYLLFTLDSECYSGSCNYLTDING